MSAGIFHYCEAISCKVCSEFIIDGDTSDAFETCRNGTTPTSCEDQSCFTVAGTAKGILK